MTLNSLLVAIGKMAISDRMIGFAGAGNSIYELNDLDIRNYPILYVSPTGSHRVEENYTTYAITLFYIDRLAEDSSNSVNIHSTSIEVLKNLIRKIRKMSGVVDVSDSYIIQLFTETERMKDRCNGAYAQLEISVVNDTICDVYSADEPESGDTPTGETYFNVTVPLNQEIPDFATSTVITWDTNKEGPFPYVFTTPSGTETGNATGTGHTITFPANTGDEPVEMTFEIEGWTVTFTQKAAEQPVPPEPPVTGDTYDIYLGSTSIDCESEGGVQDEEDLYAGEDWEEQVFVLYGCGNLMGIDKLNEYHGRICVQQDVLGVISGNSITLGATAFPIFVKPRRIGSNRFMLDTRGYYSGDVVLSVNREQYGDKVFTAVEYAHPGPNDPVPIELSINNGVLSEYGKGGELYALTESGASRLKLYRVNNIYDFWDMSHYEGRTEWRPDSAGTEGYAEQYLTFDILSAGTISMRNALNNNAIKPIEYSKDEGETWTEAVLTYNSGITISVDAGDRVMFRSDMVFMYLQFSGSTATYNVEGNLNSLVNGGTARFSHTNVVSARNLVLPIITRDTRYTRMDSDQYDNMFSDCRMLVEAPEITSTLTDDYCCYMMFRDCVSLTTAPELKAEYLVDECYNGMFSGCTSLEYVKCLATQRSSHPYARCTDNWLDGVAENGTFVKAEGAEWERGASGIPENWEIIE